MRKTLICGTYFCLLLLHQVLAVDHSSRLEEIISRKSKESHATNTHASNLLKNAKVRFEDNLASAKKRIPEISDNVKQVHNSHVAAVSEKRLVDSELGATHITGSQRQGSNALREHGVSDSLVREINNMASSYIPRETIVKHVQSHFPNKDQHEWNDIVVSAISAAGKAQPESLATTKSSKAQANFQQQQFQKAKDSLEYFQE